MTPRTFWLIFIKIIGIYLILESILISIQFVSSLYYMYTYGDKDNSGIFYLLIIGLILAFLYFLVLRYCIFRTELIVDKLNLDIGFEEEKFELNIHRSTVLKIAVIVIGGVMIVDSLPLLCKQVFSYVQLSRVNTGFKEIQSLGWSVFYFVKFFVGFSLISASRPIVNFIERKRKEPTVNQETTD